MSSEKKPGWVILYRGLYILLPSPNSRDSNKPLDVGSTPPTQDPIVANKGLRWDFQHAILVFRLIITWWVDINYKLYN